MKGPGPMGGEEDRNSQQTDGEETFPVWAKV